MKAQTLSVLLDGSSSIHMYIAADAENTTNVSVRFDQGDAATICGFPQAWLMHDQKVDEYDPSSPIGAEYIEEYGYSAHDQFEAYVSAECEIEILKAAIAGIRRQARDPMFKDRVTKAYRDACIAKCKLKIEALTELI